MKGIDLAVFTESLYPVDSEFNAKPIFPVRRYLVQLGIPADTETTYADWRVSNACYNMRLSQLSELSFDELCKLKYSSIFMMHETVRALFEEDPQYEIVRKIQSSMWRWGCGSGVWNEVVDAYDRIRHFNLGNLPDFSVRLDYTHNFNEMGRSRFANIFLDGVFGLLIYHRGIHVMTIGFSVISGKTILLQQVQLVERKGNRFLFKLPQNRVEFAIGLFKRNFPGYTIAVVDGKALSDKYIKEYRDFESRAKKRFIESAAVFQVGPPTAIQFSRFLMNETDYRDIREKREHLEEDQSRLQALYRNTGRYVQGQSLRLNKLLHHCVS